MKGMMEAAATQLAIDMACLPEDFFTMHNTVVEAAQLTGRRRFKTVGFEFRLVTFGMGAVASVDRRFIPFAKAILERMTGIDVFDAKGVYVINKELERYAMALSGFHQYYLPHNVRGSSGHTPFKLRLHKKSAIPGELYGYTGFENALLFQRNGQLGREDVLAVSAWDGGKLIGLAGASNDSDTFWQIGVEVSPEYRRKGVGKGLVSALAKEILASGAVPYYGTWWSNLASQNLAVSAGFRPAWAETQGVFTKPQ